MTLAGIKEVIPVAEETGTVMAVENHNSIFFSADDILMLINDLGTDTIKACPDPSNWVKGFLTDECSAEERETVFEGVSKLAPYAVQSHLKVAGITDDGKLAGFGDDLDRLVMIYADAGYEGCLAFETTGKEDGLPNLKQAREILQATIDRICG
jgi:sugar phosphate isomerase/epimerase